MQFPLGAMSAGDILDRGLKMLFARLPTFYAINFIVMFPLIFLVMALLFIIFKGEKVSDSTYWKLSFVYFFYPIAAAVLQPIATGAVLYIVSQQIEGKRANMWRAFSYGFSRFGTLFGASILVGLMLGVARLACCIPGIFVQAIYAFVTQAVLFEKMRVGESLQRSFSLGSKYFLHVLLLIFMIILADSVVFWSLVLGVEEILPTSNDNPSAKGLLASVNLQNLLILASLILLADILFRAYFAVCTTILYFDLRIRKEGFDLELAARLQDEEIVPNG
jgi:hypothetical protein